MSRLPPDITRAVTHIKVETTIDAKAETVWNAIIDFPAYPTWNPFVRSQAITDTSFRPLLAHPKPTVGAHLLMHVRVPPKGLDDDDQGLSTSKEVITFIDEKQYRIVWEQVGVPKWIIRTERWQEVTRLSNERESVKYTSITVFNGPGAWVVRRFMRPNLVKSFDAMADGLKEYAERLEGRATGAMPA